MHRANESVRSLGVLNLVSDFEIENHFGGGGAKIYKIEKVYKGNPKNFNRFPTSSSIVTMLVYPYDSHLTSPFTFKL